VASPESGVGLEQARYWEHAIRQALMPVTPTNINISGMVSEKKKIYDQLFIYVHTSYNT
jgi:hypothetical protein